MSNVVRGSLVCAAPAATQSARVKITRIVLRRMRTTFSPPQCSLSRQNGNASDLVRSEAPTAIDGQGSLGRRRDCRHYEAQVGRGMVVTLSVVVNREGAQR